MSTDIAAPPGGDRPDDPLLVACLCAGWCHLCDSYRVTFDALAAEFGPTCRWLWVDIEDQAALLGDLDIETFPTLMLARGDTPLFFGPVTPQPQAARQLVRRALVGDLGMASDLALAGLPQRLRAWR